MQVIQIKDVCKAFDQRQVLNNISLSVEEGEIFGLLGPSGAGKTTISNRSTLETLLRRSLSSCSSVGFIESPSTLTGANRKVRIATKIPVMTIIYKNVLTNSWAKLFFL